ncbi:imidazoleglycerol-phosphate dehydratase [Ignicoccus islandicus DSM 13165]|uniref:Imidazoleglycerol-phosphate dehydratase n=1 Tax=Ignicoccus islandicus DSM 13165 TaxID=940295 RepID=A0A0U3FNE2_9CREN|nr:hypothetical protein [Ignicoccus islandicus]ALU11855.1 imidazoleglycerol-phosphate dehydratase [Ignicoccus islandicus DSM 13165]
MKRTTRETEVEVKECDQPSVEIEIPFFKHMIETLIKHSKLNVCVKARDLQGFDDHHLVEDVAITFGRFLKELFRKELKNRFAWSIVPMDEALALCSVDVSGRGGFFGEMEFKREEIGGLALENVSHFFETLARESSVTLHLRLLSGSNDHHKVEALFKSLALCIAKLFDKETGVVSAKGVIDLG